MATDPKRAYQIERRFDQLMAARGLMEDPFAIHLDADLYAEPERAVDAELSGTRQTHVFLVAMSMSGRYEAFTPDGVIRGCAHTVQGITLKWARLDAVTDHQQRCIGRQVNTRSI